MSQTHYKIEMVLDSTDMYMISYLRQINDTFSGDYIEIHLELINSQISGASDNNITENNPALDLSPEEYLIIIVIVMIIITTVFLRQRKR